MAKLLLAISGRVEEGEALGASVFNTATGTSALTGFTLQWQVFNGSTWANVGTANSLTFTIPSGNSAIGKSYRLVSTPTGANEASASAPTAPVVGDTKSVHAPTLGDVATSLSIAENAAATLLDGAVTFSDADNGNFGGGSLTILNSNSLAAGGDGQDVLSVRNQGTGAGQISFNAATREVFWSAQAGSAILIGVVDAALGGNGADLKVAFNANATKAAIDKLIENIQFSNNDDSPTGARLLTIKVTDATAGSVQRAIQVNVNASADGPSFTGPSIFTVNENQLLVGTIAAIDPDREAAAVQGISYSFVAGTGSADNALFTINAATGQLNFVSAPDFEGAHAPAYSVRVRASDSNGGVSDRVIAVQVQSVNETPVAQALAATIQEDAAATSLTAIFVDPDASDSHTLMLNTAGTLGNVTRQGSNFLYDAGNQFQSLGQGQTAVDTFSYAVTDAGGLSSTHTATITIVGSNDTAVIAGTAGGSVQEDVAVTGGQLTAQGTLTVTDVDAGQAAFVARTGAPATYGSFDVDAGGHWTYRVNNSLPALQALSAASTLSDSFTVSSLDGTASQTVTVTILGKNDWAVIGGTTYSSVQEDVGVVNGMLSTSGTLTVTDPDAGQSQFLARAAVAGSNGYGTFSLNAAGQWTYAVANNLAAVQALPAGGLLADSFWATTSDGSSTLVSVAIAGTNDLPVVSVADTPGTVTESGAQKAGVASVGGFLTASDADAGETLTWAIAGGDAHGTFYLYSATGQWEYALNNSAFETEWLAQGETATVQYLATVTDSKGASSSQTVTITIEGANDAPAIYAGEGGTVVESSPPNGSLLVDYSGANDYDNGFACDSQGRVLITGYRLDPTTGNTVRSVSRLDADGSVDSSYGADGHVDFDNLMGVGFLAVDSSDRALVVGSVQGGYGPGETMVDMAVTRFNSDGTLDTAFGVGGLVKVDIEGGYDHGEAVLVDSAGRLLLIGGGMTTQGHGLAVVRLNADGTLDSTFGSGGKWGMPMGSTHDVAVDGSGRVVVWTTDSYTGSGQLLRLNEDGSSDTTFGIGGVAAFDAGVGPAKLVAASDGTLLLAWTEYNQTTGLTQVELARFNQDGTLDAAFGEGGQVHTSVEAASFLSLAVDALGRPVVSTSSGAAYDVAVARFNTDGTPDVSFGVGGLVLSDLGGSDQGEQVFMKPDGKILVAGHTDTLTGRDIALAQFDQDGSDDTDFGVMPDDVAIGWLGAFDIDAGSTILWSGDAEGVYGTFEVDSASNSWSYSLDNSRAATQALSQAQTVTETFTVTATDEFGATDTDQITITIIGTYDPPAP